MFLGHFSVALAAKRAGPRPSLGWLIAACEFPDLLWPVFVLAGWERFRIEPGNTAFTPLAFDHYPWSHSLLMDVVWGVALGTLYWALRRDRRGAVVVAAVVVSHWVLDWISHRPDMPLLPWSDAKLGLELWRSVPATLAVEAVLFAGAIALYTRSATPRDRIGSVGLRVMLAFLVVMYLGAAFGPPPPSVNAVAVSSLALWLLLPLSAWIDRHRTPGNP